jgi:hypothetical protein
MKKCFPLFILLDRTRREGLHHQANEYLMPFALKQVDARVLLIHDEDDKEIPLSDAFQLKHARDDLDSVLTKGAGHQRILANRTMIRAVKDFLV